MLIALGANVDGHWGKPRETLKCAIKELSVSGLPVGRISSLYRTKAYGAVRQPNYLNAVAEAKCALSPRMLLLLFKHIERVAGRRNGARNGPRPLDIDLIDYKGRVLGWPPSNARAAIVLPHPLIANRAFVLAPLAELVPHWRHPVYGLTAERLLQRLGGTDPIMLRREIFEIDSVADL